ncbi:MAG: lipid-A-disaccharide synthase N-terminal domain-containing protein [Thermodesulfobacteriota bacterium]
MECISFFSFVTDFLQDLSVRYPKFQLDFWVLFGFLGQAMFTMRFVVQWIASEKRKESVIPVAFWYFSLGGGLILLAYAIRQMDPVFIAAYLLNPIIYFRNLYFIYKKRTLTEISHSNH